MGARTRDSLLGQTQEKQAARRADFAQAQKQYESRKRFGQTSTRTGGLTPEQIGDAPTMEDDDPRRRGRLGFGGASILG